MANALPSIPAHERIAAIWQVSRVLTPIEIELLGSGPSDQAGVLLFAVIDFVKVRNPRRAASVSLRSTEGP